MCEYGKSDEKQCKGIVLVYFFGNPTRLLGTVSASLQPVCCSPKGPFARPTSSVLVRWEERFLLF